MRDKLRHSRLRQPETSGSTAGRADERTASPPDAVERPFRPFQRQLEQENQPELRPASLASNHLKRDTAARPITGVLDRPPPQPLRPAHIISRKNDSPEAVRGTPPHTHTPVASRPAPSMEQNPSVELLSLAHTAPVSSPNAQHPVSDVTQQAATLPTQPVQSGKRSFLVS